MEIILGKIDFGVKANIGFLFEDSLKRSLIDLVEICACNESDDFFLQRFELSPFFGGRNLRQVDGFVVGVERVVKRHQLVEYSRGFGLAQRAHVPHHFRRQLALPPLEKPFERALDDVRAVDGDEFLGV